MAVTINKQGSHKAVIRFAANGVANTVITPANLAVGSETVSGFTITRIYWSGQFTINRGLDLLYLSNSDHWDLRGGLVLTEYPTANLTINATGSSNSSIIIEVAKTSDFVQPT